MAALFSTLFVILALAAAMPAFGQSTADRWLGSDKPVHALAAYVAAGSGYGAGIESGRGPAERRRAAIGVALAASLAKETFDVAQGERWSWKDLGADAAGILLFVGLTLVAEQ